MKGCFLLQRRFAYLGHAIAVTLKKNYGVNDFCAYVYLRASHEWLEGQQDICYTSLLLDEEIHNRYRTEPLDLAYLNAFEK